MESAQAELAALSSADRQLVESWLREFLRSWDENRLASFVRKLPAAGHPLRLPALVEMVKLDLREQWKRGRRAIVEAYLKVYPELGGQDTAPVGLILAEYEMRVQAGATKDLPHFARRFPQQFPALQRLVREARGGGPAVELVQAKEATVEPEPGTRWPSHPPNVPLTLPERFGRYCIVKQLGHGGMGAVYLANDLDLERRVALKVPHLTPEDGPEVLERFRREARAAAKLQHPNICPVYEVGEINGVSYLTMAFIEGKTLAELLKGGKSLAQRDAVAVVRTLAQALQEAHNRGIIHRDLKPSNVMINERGEPVLMDFGLARRLDDSVRLTRMGETMGTPAYMPPEQVEGKIDAMGPGCDIYSLGVILYELLTGRVPFEGQMAMVLAQILTQEPRRPSALRPDLDSRLDAICLRALQKSIQDRYPNMADFAVALTGYLRTSAPVVDITSPMGPTITLPHGIQQGKDFQHAPTQPLPEEGIRKHGPRAPLAPIPIELLKRGKSRKLLLWGVIVALVATLGIVVTLILLSLKSDPAAPAGPKLHRGKTVAQWAEALKNGDAKVRDEAAAALVEVQAEAVPLLAAALKEGKAEVRITTVKALGRIGKSAVPALPELLGAFQDADAHLREAAILAAGEICGQAKAWGTDVLEALCQRLKSDTEPRVRGAAATALGGTDGTAPIVQAAMASALRDDASVSLRKQVARALGRMGDKAIGQLREALKDDSHVVRLEALTSLKSLSDTVAAEAIPELTRCAASEDDQVRRVALDTLTDILKKENSLLRRGVVALARVGLGQNGRALVPDLVKALNDPDEELRFHAAVALSWLRDEASPAVEMLIDGLKSEKLSWRRQAVVAVGRIGPLARDAVPTLRAYLADPDEETRFNVAVAFWNLQAASEQALSDLVKRLADRQESMRVRTQSAVAISGIGFSPEYKDAMPTILDVVRDRDERPLVRERALWAVETYLRNTNADEGGPVYQLLLDLLNEPAAKETKLVRYDAAYQLGLFQRSDAPVKALDVLSEFLKDSSVKATLSGRADKLRDDRIMAVEALAHIGVQRLMQRPEIVEQLRRLDADPNVTDEFSRRIKKLLDDLKAP